MKAKWLGLALVSAAVVTGCGEGRAIFNVDLYSFLKGTGSDTVPYFALPGFSADTASPPRKVNLPGAGSSIVDSVRAFGTVDLVNATGSGTIGLQVYLAADSLGTYKPSALAINVPSKSVSGTNTTRDTIRVDLSAAFDSLFTKSQLWIRFGASVSNPGATTLQGKAVLASLLLTVIIKDKFF
ncbi:MAG: hypothetical protein AUH45_00795 [Gemmatimonadetes bacterium 13_1_40CM_69_22]|nr:MAG: hypothetical protein AUH45_00795 [Gemmatimonadetes bacterium 13_1_40CM_69_22]